MKSLLFIVVGTIWDVLFPKDQDRKYARLEPPEYANLWMAQSNLFWGRLQTATAIHTAVLGVWYFLNKEEENIFLAKSVLFIGFFLSLALLFIMRRDVQYMRQFKNDSNGAIWCSDTFLNGPRCAIFMMCLLMGVELFLFFSISPTILS